MPFAEMSGTNKFELEKQRFKEKKSQEEVEQVIGDSNWSKKTKVGSDTKKDLVQPAMTEFFAENFKILLPKNPKIQAVFWSFEEETIRIWTIITEPDNALEEQITQAQMSLMDQYPHLEYDFSVIYSFGKPLGVLKPDEAKVVG
jgi:hypothetical protein